MPTDQLRLREATGDDVVALVALVESAYRGEASRAGWTTEADLLDGQRVDAAMLDEAMADPDVTVLVAERDGAIVGCCELRRSPDAAWLGMFAVDPGRQGDGLGRRVLAAGEAHAAERWAARRLRLQVLEPRRDLIDWYERRGYRPTGEHVPFPYGDERFGQPRRDDLRFVVLERPLGGPDAPG